MTANELLNLLIQGAFGVIALIAWADYFRGRLRARLDIALVLSSLAIPIILPAFMEAFDIDALWLSALSNMVLIAHPYLLLRLVEHFRPVPLRVRRFAIVGLLLFITALLLLVLSPALRTSATAFLSILLVFYLISVEGFAARALFQDAWRMQGVTRVRLRLAAAGIVMIALLLLTLGVIALFPASQSTLQTLILFLALLAALGFYLGFVPPRWLRRSWQLEELHNFLQEVGSHPVAERHSRVLALLCDWGLRVVGGEGAIIALWDDASSELQVTEATHADYRSLVFDVNSGVIGQVWQSREPEIVMRPRLQSAHRDQAPDIPAEVLLVAPVRSSERLWGVVIILFQKAPLFATDDLHLLALMGEQVAVLLSNRSLLEQQHELVDELGQANIDLQQQVQQRLNAETALRRAHDDLEHQVRERTAALTEANRQLQREVGERERAVRALRAFTARLEQSNRELQDFAYVASHDLQEPLRKIQAFGDRLRAKEGDNLSAASLDYLQRMQNAASRMQILINDLLAFSRVTTKAQPFVPVELDRIVREVVSDLEIRIEQTEGQVIVGDLPQIDADPVQMRQLFQNLIGNALKFHGDAPPRVTVRAELLDGPSSGESVEPGDATQARITIEDNGIGFDEKYLDRIFTPFQRLHGRTEYEGTGIGLAICRKIVARHGGQLVARSAPGAGSAFIIILPIVHSDESEAS